MKFLIAVVLMICHSIEFLALLFSSSITIFPDMQYDLKSDVPQIFLCSMTLKAVFQLVSTHSEGKMAKYINRIKVLAQ